MLSTATSDCNNPWTEEGKKTCVESEELENNGERVIAVLQKAYDKCEVAKPGESIGVDKLTAKAYEALKIIYALF
ncbi:hypothetical protein OESDEN_20119 [Oesophagostomum dentatum]|uniref:Uncharacterized protein n=1 Tax=Oesophagostomum dentatum TaxID=61180 RepID=A0A0B1S5K8_OESDE|nr:hypothetical protein OESDEN_20119 [Oesophagostomum dentatum]